jgi:hypothetical protein
VTIDTAVRKTNSIAFLSATTDAVAGSLVGPVSVCQSTAVIVTLQKGEEEEENVSFISVLASEVVVYFG